MPFSPRQLVDDVAALMRVRAQEKRLSLEVRASGPLPEIISSDPERVRQILINLIGNAIKFTPENGAVGISVIREDGLPVVRVREGK